MKILITGSSGFLGSHLCKNLNSFYDITGIDKTVNCLDNCKQFFTDITKKNTELSKIISDVDLVIHLASPVGIDTIDKNSSTFLEEMLKINLNIFNLVKAYNKKIIFFSTSEVYLNTKDGIETDNLTIGTPDKLRWGYASGKLTSEFLCKSLCKNNIIIRPFNITGQGDNKGVLYKFISSIKKCKDILIHGNGKQQRTFCDIRDLNNFINALIQRDIYNGEIYNVGNVNNVISINNLAKLCINKSNSDININYIPYSEIFSKNFDDINIRIPNCNKMNKIYKSTYDIGDIIESML